MEMIHCPWCGIQNCESLFALNCQVNVTPKFEMFKKCLFSWSKSEIVEPEDGALSIWLS